MPHIPFLNQKPNEDRYRLASNQALIAACLAGEASAWETLINRYAALIYSQCLRMGVSRADAEDIFQDVCVLLLDHLENLRDTTKLSSWLLSTTKREVWRWQRRRGAILASELGDGEWEMESAESIHSQPSENPEAGILALEEQQMMRDAMTHLPERCRYLLTRLYVEDPPATYADLAANLAMPVGSLGPTRARCLQSLRKILTERGF